LKDVGKRMEWKGESRGVECRGRGGWGVGSIGRGGGAIREEG